MGDVTITFAGSLQISGKVEYVHPLHNLAIVSYDPELIGDTPVRAAKFSTDELTAGDDVWVIGLGGDHELVHQASKVSSVEAITLPLSRTMRFRDSNLETISLVNAPTDIDGVLTNEKGEVELVDEFVAVVRSGQPVYSLELELGYMPLFAARKRGLHESWLEKLEKHNPRKRRALNITRLVAGAPAAKILKNGDIILAVDNEIVTTFRELERAVQKPEVDVTVWRDGEALDLEIETVALDGVGIEYGCTTGNRGDRRVRCVLQLWFPGHSVRPLGRPPNCRR
jgi:hypothetical protein